MELLKEPVEALYLLSERQVLVPLHQLQEPVEPARCFLRSEHRVVLPQRYSALHAHQVYQHNRLGAARPVTPAPRHLQAPAPADKRIPAQFVTERALALLGNALHSGHKNDVPQW